ncbi:polysaccharide biosynthesis/export family protein [Lyngbya confervoides]|uniref:SLBB domain-containing protein n=1 Tax=Lyngbya confervoides BDU141951 TaxID=1574623 RepID=A0ABD4T2A3_9CYAN|nr:SLBB domain-containing protein [Lyngbya confervoides]MCM1982724.1 SLBB domain-containing protein [Lyngbya confervoides BDU141951]
MVSSRIVSSRNSNLWVVNAPRVAGLSALTLMLLGAEILRPNPTLAQISAPETARTSTGSAPLVEYVLGPGDEIKLDMYGQDNLFTTSYIVLVDGTISLPFIGRVGVGGSTISQAQQLIAQRYTQFFKRPYVTVVLLKPRDIKVNIAGEVLRPGPYPIPQTEQNPTVSSLIKLAGGHSQSADLQNVEVRRPRKDGTEEVLKADILRLIRDGDGSQNLFLRDGDTVIVRPALTTDLADTDLLGNNSLTPSSSEPLNVAVVGEVYRPGPYVISSANAIIREAGDQGTQSGANSLGQPRLTQAIQRAGGIKPEADVRKIQIRRITRFGDEKILEVDLWKLLQEGDLKQDIALQNRDTIIIPTATDIATSEKIELSESTLSPETIDVNIVGEVRQPGLVKIRPNTPLSQAVLAAGGFDNKRANKKSVDLIRLEPDGTVNQRRITLSFDGEINEQTNPALKNNDVVVIRRSGLTQFSDNFGSVVSPFTGVFSFIRLLPGL